MRKDFDGRLVNTIDVDPRRASLIQWAFKTYAAGNHSLPALQEELTEQGLTSRATPKRPERPLSLSQLAVILHDPYYTGVVPYRGNLYPGRHTPLIGKETFLKVQDVFAERARRGQRDRKHHHFLKGMLYCGRCHLRDDREGRLIYTEVTGNGGTYEYFLCSARHDTHCDMGSLPAWEVEDAVADCFAGLALPNAFITAMRSDVLAALETAQETDRSLRAHLAKQLRILRDREERLLDLAADDQLNTDVLRARLHTLKIERAAAQERLERTDNQIESGIQSLLLHLDMLSNPDKLYRTSSDSVRRQLLDAFFTNLYVYKAEDSIEAVGVQREAIARLQTLANPIPAIDTNITTRRSPRANTRAPKEVRVGPAKAGHLDLGLTKAVLVGLTGFEPATP